MYHCKKCDKSFEKRKAYIGHCSSHNRGDSYKVGRKKKHKVVKSLDCHYCGVVFTNAKSLGGHLSGCKLNPNYKNKCEKLSIIAKNRTIPKETRDKISKSRKLYLDNNPGNIPYLLNHSSKESYPEKLFREKLEKENIVGWVQEYPILRYSLDFAFVDLKLDIEIDGGTHSSESVLKKDFERDKRLSELGWNILRLNATDIKNDIDREFNKVRIALGSGFESL
jgi:very-short-patch-repair endonuclease